jgi:hypothetical protein
LHAFHAVILSVAKTYDAGSVVGMRSLLFSESEMALRQNQQRPALFLYL